MKTLTAPMHCYASNLTGARVDLANCKIYSVVVMTIGKAFGHASVDLTTLEQFKAAVESMPKVRGRENHPDEILGSSPITKKVEDLRGYFFNFRIDETGTKLLADFQGFSANAGGTESIRLLHKAAEAPEIFGVSPVFFGDPENGMARVQKVVAIDFVDIPAGDNANQQLFKGEHRAMKFSINKNAAGKYEIMCDADGDVKSGEKYAADFTEMEADAEEKKKAAMAAEEEKKKSEMAAKAAADEAAKTALAASGTAQTYSAADLAKARAEGAASVTAYSAEFDATMDGASLEGKERDEFRAAHYVKGQTFGIQYVKDIAKYALASRTKAVGGGGVESVTLNKGSVNIAEACTSRFAAKEHVRFAWGCKTAKADSAEYKAALAEYVKSSIEAEANYPALKAAQA